MKTIFWSCLAAALLGGSLSAQTEPQPPARPKPGTIIDSSESGRITSGPTAPKIQAPAKPAASTDPLAGRKVDRFEATGNTSVASDTIRVYLGVVPGEAYDPAAIQRNFPGLWQTGLFDDIRIEASEAEGGGVVVHAIVKERPRIGSVEYRGNKELATNKITEALEKEKMDLHIGSTIEQTQVRRAAEAIKKAYQENGYEDPSVDPSIVEMPGGTGEKKIIFNINEGVKPKVADVVFVGNQRFSSRKLRSVMKEVKPHNIITWARKRDLYIPSKLDADIENLKNFYQDNGYFGVTFGEPKITNSGTVKSPRVRITIPITEGTVYHFGEVSVTGNTVFTNQQVIGDWPIKKGDVLRRKPVQSRADAFGEAYRMRGYIYAYVNPQYVPHEGTNVMDVKMDIYEGDQFRLGRLEFSGNTNTRDKVLRREIFLNEGMIMDMETFKQSVYKLGQLGYFKVSEDPDFKVNPDTKTVDVNIKGSEEGKNDVQFGGGYSEGGGFFVQSQFGTRNLFGSGENVSLSLQKGTRVSYFALSYADPWFRDTPNSLGVSIFDRDTQYPAVVGYTNRGKGGTIAYGYRLRRFDSLSLVYGAERARIHYEVTAPPDANGNVPVALISDYNYTISSIAPAYHYDSRDNPFDTTRGTRIGFNFSFSGGPLGGTVHAIKPTANYTHFFRLSRRSSISTNIEGGRIFPLSHDCANSRIEQLENTKLQLCVPETERFLVGGEYSVRGFKTYTLGPTEDNGLGTQIPSGGYKYHVANLEYIFKVNDPLRAVLWADAGQAYAYNEKWALGRTRYTAGAELRIFLPVFQFPLRFIYAVNLSPKPGDQFDSFQFTIGNTY